MSKLWLFIYTLNNATRIYYIQGVFIESYCNDFIDVELVKIFQKKFKISEGYFVDVGANDGVTGSNTYLFEKKGWKGLLIEPNQNLKKNLEKHRKMPIEFCAISSQETISFNIVEGPENLHGLSRIDCSNDFTEHIKKHGGKVIEKTIPAKKLGDLLIKHNVSKKFNLLSVDVEGHELTVLKTINLAEYKPQVIVSEDNFKGKDPKVKNYLKEQGYTLVRRIGVNEIYSPDKYILKFLSSYITVRIKYFRWQVKRFLLKLIGSEEQNQLI